MGTGGGGYPKAGAIKNMSCEKEPFEKEISSSNHQFSGDMLVFREVKKWISPDLPGTQSFDG